MPRTDVVEVELSLHDFVDAGTAALVRMIESHGMGLNPASTYVRTPIERLQEETAGTFAEIAMARLVGVRDWTPLVNTFHNVADCLHDIEVRATTLFNGRLIVRDNDADDRRYVFFIVNGQNAWAYGWCYGADAKKAKYEDNPNGYRLAWFVPPDDLRAMNTLEVYGAAGERVFMRSLYQAPVAHCGAAT
jgi:hypothetical protein